MKVRCTYCMNELDSDSKGAARAVSGWVSPRSGGGTNHVRYMRPGADWAHIACLDEYHKPVETNQGSLFGDDKPLVSRRDFAPKKRKKVES